MKCEFRITGLEKKYFLDWPEAFSSSADILEYMKKVARKYDLYPHVQNNTEVKSTVWNEASRKWSVTLWNKKSKMQDVFQFDIV